MTDLKSFHEAVKAGDLDAVRRGLAEQPDLLNGTNAAGQSALLLAKYYRQEKVAEYLLGQGPALDLFLASAVGETATVLKTIDADPSLLETHSSDGWTPLHLAAFFGHSELAQALIDRGATIDSRSTNAMRNTPLHAATAGRKLEVIHLLLHGGANVNATQEGGWTALHAAAQNGDREMFELLLAHGADLQARAENQQTALDLALVRGHGEIATLIDSIGPQSTVAHPHS